MFDQLVESTSAGKKSKRWPYFTATATVWMMALAMIIVTGIFAYDARLDDQYTVMALAAPLPPPAPSPPRVSERRPSAADTTRPAERFTSLQVAPDKISAPRQSPPGLPDFDKVQGNIVDSGNYPTDGSGRGIPNGVEMGEHAGDKMATPPPPLPQQKKQPPSVKPQTLYRPSRILQGSAIRRVEPAYPAPAKTIHVSGAVVVEVTVDEQGEVASARVLSGPALLRDASLRAARGWRWNPTLLNGVAVKVVGTITFNFRL